MFRYQVQIVLQCSAYLRLRTGPRAANIERKISTSLWSVTREVMAASPRSCSSAANVRRNCRFQDLGTGSPMADAIRMLFSYKPK